MLIDIVMLWLLAFGGHETETALEEQYETYMQLYEVIPEADTSSMARDMQSKLASVQRVGETVTVDIPADAKVLEGVYVPEFIELTEPEPELPDAVARHATLMDGEYVLHGDARIIADCESGAWLADGSAVPHSYDWTNINGQGSSAAGAFQFVNRTWIWIAHDGLGFTQYPTALDAPPEVQIQAFYLLWDNGNGRQHWSPSQSCWGRHIP